MHKENLSSRCWGKFNSLIFLKSNINFLGIFVCTHLIHWLKLQCFIVSWFFHQVCLFVCLLIYLWEREQELVIYFYLFIYLFMRARARASEHAGQRERQRIPSRLCTVRAEPDVGLKFTDYEIMNWAEMFQLSWTLNRLSRLGTPQPR